jgi:hypothetical protein
LTWKEKVTKSSRLLFQLSPSTLPTDEIGCGLLLTPSTVTIEGGEDRVEKRTKYRESIGRHYVPGCLAEQMAILPTPRAGNPGSRPNEKGGKILAAEVGKPTGLKLQPNFVEWMMGFPRTWTELPSPNPVTESNASRLLETL